MTYDTDSMFAYHQGHRYRWWGLGHDSHPEDPQGCCELPKEHPVHDPKRWEVPLP